MNAQNAPDVTAQWPCPSHGPSVGRSSRQIVVRRLEAGDLPEIGTHLLAQDSAGRQSRFHAFLGDDAILNHVGAVDFQRVILAGAFDLESSRLVGLAEAHLDAAVSPLRAKISISVLASHRCQGIGRMLAAAVLDAAAARGTRRADFYYQPNDQAIAGLVRDLGTPVATAPGFASLALPLGVSVLH